MWNLSDVKASGPRTIPDGEYTCAVVEAAVKETKSGTGEYIAVTFKIKTGEYEGNKIFTNFNVKNENATAVEIGMSQLKSLLIQSGAESPDKLNSVEDLLGLTVGVKTKTKSDPTWGDKTEVSYFFKTPAQGQSGTPPTSWV